MRKPTKKQKEACRKAYIKAIKSEPFFQPMSEVMATLNGRKATDEDRERWDKYVVDIEGSVVVLEGDHEFGDTALVMIHYESGLTGPMDYDAQEYGMDTQGMWIEIDKKAQNGMSTNYDRQPYSQACCIVFAD